MDFMPFGKYRGEPLAEVPDAYVEWLLSIELREPLLGAVLREVEVRGLEIGEVPATVGVDMVAVQRVYRELAIEYHPDKARGNGDIMRGINIFRDRLRAACGV